MAESIRLLVADDHAIVREALRALIATEPGMQLVGEAADGVEAALKARALQPDVILLDLVMPRQDGIETIGEIIRQNPAARILVLTSFAEEDRVLGAIRAGALGYVMKDSSPPELLQAIRAVHGGESWLHPSAARTLIREINRPSALLPPDEPLTEREVAVLALVAQGLSNEEIGAKLSISERTVRTHVTHILDKLHLENRTQAALYALRKGLATLDPT